MLGFCRIDRVGWLGAALLVLGAGAAGAEDQCKPDRAFMRVVGGEPAAPEVSGWQVSLRINGDHFCGGSLMDPSGRWVLTAAHCISDDLPVNSDAFTVEHGSSKRGEGKTQQVERIFVKEKWTGQTSAGNDIALLRLAGAMDVRAGGRRVALLATNTYLEKAHRRGDTCAVVTGWGSMEAVRSARSGLPRDLQMVGVPLVTRVECEKGYGRIAPDQICAGYPRGGKDSCQGDSGGPLVVKGPSGYTQVGVVSWGKGCAAPEFYGVYTDIGYHADWIKEIMRQHP